MARQHLDRHQPLSARGLNARLKPGTMADPAMQDNRPKLHDAFQGWNLHWQGLLSNQQGEWWLVVQVALIVAVLAVPGWPSPTALPLSGFSTWPVQLLGGGLLIAGLLLAGAAFLSLGANLSPLPDPKPGSALVDQGPYQLCRHPMYLAVLICAAGVMLMRLSGVHVLLLILMALTLRGKARREERGLLKRDPAYATLFQGSVAIAPWIPGLNWPLTQRQERSDIA